MAKVNWKVRVKNKSFWLAIIPAVLVVVQLVAGWFDIPIAADLIGAELAKLVNGVFTVLILLGIVTDHTTDGVGDSKQALGYVKPRKDDE
ncbi:holin, phage phi LC3 family [Oceanobacillus limi]|uniref:Holin, phage phi LC3 family n=1 Tax=Oceanobacillus limi TaxID=930131 RepID=A0A1I0GEZ4_9BACI|nr:phage holin [Oceanobacillus limi]SET69392.1 holin, phage phi LC3 family [Oceanobacillus limi]